MEEREKECLNVLKDVLGPYELSPIVVRTLRFFLRNPYESLVVINKDGFFEFLDRGSERFFNLPPGGAKGLNTELFQCLVGDVTTLI